MEENVVEVFFYLVDKEDNHIDTVSFKGVTAIQRFLKQFVGDQLVDDGVTDMDTLMKVFNRMDSFFTSLSKHNQRVLAYNLDHLYELKSFDWDKRFKKFVEENLPWSMEDDDWDIYFWDEVLMALYYSYEEFKNTVETKNLKEVSKVEVRFWD